MIAAVETLLWAFEMRSTSPELKSLFALRELIFGPIDKLMAADHVTDERLIILARKLGRT